MARRDCPSSSAPVSQPSAWQTSVPCSRTYVVYYSPATKTLEETLDFKASRTFLPLNKVDGLLNLSGALYAISSN